MGYSTYGRSILETHDEFVCEVPLGDWRTILVYRRSHGGRDYVRFWTWNQQRAFGLWYPTKRGFIIPMDEASALADAIRAAVEFECGVEPDWVNDYSDYRGYS